MDEGQKRFWDTFEQMQEDIDRLFDHYARAKQPSLVSFRARWAPPCNVYEAADSIRVLVELAGMRRDALDLRLEDQALILRGHRAVPELPCGGHYHQMEIAFGEFELEVALPAPVDAEAVQAWYQDGFLAVLLPKASEAKPVRITLTVPER